MTRNAKGEAEWAEDCLKERGEVLRGQWGHWCPDWDGLTVDETCSEWRHGCNCFPQVKRAECPKDCPCNAKDYPF